jgi:hypothetical protein
MKNLIIQDSLFPQPVALFFSVITGTRPLNWARLRLADISGMGEVKS